MQKIKLKKIISFFKIIFIISILDIFEIVAEPNIDLLKKKIIVNPESVNSLNEFDYTPLDLALMLNYESAIKILLSNEAVENSKCKKKVNFIYLNKITRS